MKISVKNILAGIAGLVIIGLAFVYVPRVLREIYPPVNTTTSPPHTPVVPADTVSIGFYNVENLFDLIYDGGEYPEYRPGALGWNQQTFDKKLANISSVITALKVDIIGLCEIENRNTLETLRAALKNRGCEFPYFAIADYSGKGSTCPSLLSKYPITHSRELRVQGDGGHGRGILEADIDCGAADTLKVFVNHWPSKMHPESQRLVMARALRTRLEALSEHCDYVVIGDLNTDYDEWSKVHATGLDDTRGLVGLNHCLKTVHSGPGAFVSYVTRDEMCRCDSLVHYDLWLELPEAKRFSRKYRTDPETFDHILCPRSMFDAYGLSFCANKFEAFTWNDALMKNGEPFRWQMKGFGKRRFHTGEGYSDHLPLRAQLVRGPWHCDTAKSNPPVEKPTVKNKGFELSTEGWTGCSREIEVSRDTIRPYNGRYSLRLDGTTGKNNITACRTVLHREANPLSRSMKISLAIRGEGKLSLRMRSLTGKAGEKVSWQYYKGETFAHSGASRFLPVKFKSWRKVVLTYTAESAATSDVEFEIRAGKESPFCFSFDDVRME
jgi:hypothetical protein